MSLTKLLKAPIKLFMKENITFVIVRRYDLGLPDEKLRYIEVRPSASISMLRQKVWHLLDLPDYCEEVIILKSVGDVEIPLTQLRNGNDPQHPYVLEVWLPGKQMQLACNTTTVLNNMITMGAGSEHTCCNLTPSCIFEGCNGSEKYAEGNPAPKQSNETMVFNKLRVQDNKLASNTSVYTDFKKCDLTCHMSRSSIFRMKSNKSQDNVVNILVKIQNDLVTLSSKLTNLENRIS